MVKGDGMGSGRNAPKLPKQQLTILAICRFAEPVAMTSVSIVLTSVMWYQLTLPGIPIHSRNDQVVQCSNKFHCQLRWHALFGFLTVPGTGWHFVGSSIRQIWTEAYDYDRPYVHYDFQHTVWLLN